MCQLYASLSFCTCVHVLVTKHVKSRTCFQVRQYGRSTHDPVPRVTVKSASTVGEFVEKERERVRALRRRRGRRKRDTPPRPESETILTEGSEPSLLHIYIYVYSCTLYNYIYVCMLLVYIYRSYIYGLNERQP